MIVITVVVIRTIVVMVVRMVIIRMVTIITPSTIYIGRPGIGVDIVPADHGIIIHYIPAVVYIDIDRIPADVGVIAIPCVATIPVAAIIPVRCIPASPVDRTIVASASWPASSTHRALGGAVSKSLRFRLQDRDQGREEQYD